jgi:dTDP-D-glucose 4,6-dehydratase
MTKCLHEERHAGSSSCSSTACRCDGGETSSIGLLHLLAEQTGTPEADYTKLITFVPDRLGHDRRYALASGALWTSVGWQPLEGLETGMRTAVGYVTRTGGTV